MKRFKRSTCPECRQRATKVMEVVTAWAYLDYYPANRAFEYGGESDIDWDSQETHRAGNLVTLACPIGHIWRTREVNK